MRSVATIILLAASLGGAELPLGLVEKADKDVVLVRFDAAARLAAGQMAALYGPGSVVKHPLTRKVVTEDRKLLAKAQVVAADGQLTRLRVLWRAEGATPEAGWDCVPLPGEAAPNSPPAATAEIKPVAAAGGATVAIRVPIADADGDPLLCTWELAGPAGRCGRLDARVTTSPEIAWTAPAIPADGMALKLTVRDPLGQEAAVSIPLTVQGADDPRHARKVFAALGADQDPAWAALERADDGSWIGIDDAGRLVRAAPGWLTTQVIAPAGDAAPRKAVAIQLRNHEIHVLDAGRQQVAVFSESGQPKRVLGGLSSPTDLAVAADGTTAVADAGSGGVMVFEPSGRFRVRAGRSGGDDGFGRDAPTRVCFGGEGEIIALDAEARRVHRYARDMRRLDTWTVTGDPKVAAVDIAWHPRGLAVLLADGSVQLYSAKGTVAETWKSAAQSGLGDELGEARTIGTDPSGEAIVTYRGAVAARHAADGRTTGLRGPQLRRSQSLWVADGLGRTIGLDTDYSVLWTYDAEGWRIARAGGRVKDGGPFGRAKLIAGAPDGSAVAVFDSDKESIVRLDPRDWRKPPVVFGSRGTNSGQFKSPVSIALDEAGRTYVLDSDLYRVSVFDPSGQFLFAFGEKGSAPNQLDDPVLVAVAADGSMAWIHDEDRYEMKKYVLDQAAKTGTHAATAGGKGSEPGQFRGVAAMAADRGGLLHVLDTSRGDWQIVDFRGPSLLPLFARKNEDVLRNASTLAVSPDGQDWLAGAGTLIGLR